MLYKVRVRTTHLQYVQTYHHRGDLGIHHNSQDTRRTGLPGIAQYQIPSSSLPLFRYVLQNMYVPGTSFFRRLSSMTWDQTSRKVGIYLAVEKLTV